MRDIIKKALTVALSAVLVFVALVPVPVGNQRVDSVTHQKAEAAVPAVAVPVIAATVLAACGVYIVGTTEITYNGNRTTVANALIQYLGNTIYDGTEAASEALSSCVTPEGNIDLGALAQTGILGAIPAFASAMIEQGSATVGENSVLSPVFNLSGNSIKVAGDTPFHQEMLEAAGVTMNIPDRYYYIGGCYYDFQLDSSSTQASKYLFYFYYDVAPDGTVNLTTSNDSQGNLILWTPQYCYYDEVRLRADGSVYQVDSGSLGRSRLKLFYDYTPAYETELSALHSFNVNNSSITSAVDDAINMRVKSDVLSDSFVAPETTVEPFEPTAEQLEAGYDSTAVIEAQIGEVNGNLADVIARINAQTQALSGIGTTLEALRGLVNGTATNVDAISVALNSFPGLLQGILDAVTPLNNGLSGILTALNPLAAILSAVTSILGVLTGLQASPFTWLSSWWGTLTANWQDLLDWLGATPFGQAVDGVIDALGQVGAGVASGAADVLGGVQALGQTLAGELQGVLDGVLSIPASIAATLDGILAAEAEAQYTPSGEGLRLRDELRAQLEAQLDMKAPFCYMRRMQALASTVSGNFGGSPSFYFDVDMPYAGVQRFDAGELLNQEWGTLTLAQYIRVMITATLCAGLLAVSLKIAIGRIGNKEG